MKTTIYELLGMIKDGKAPKKIKFNNIYCYYRECKNEYVDYTNKPIIQWDYVVMNSLNDEVEILETTITYTPNELKWGGKIKKIERCDEHDMTPYGELHNPTDNEKILMFKINEIIDKVNGND